MCNSERIKPFWYLYLANTNISIGPTEIGPIFSKSRCDLPGIRMHSEENTRNSNTSIFVCKNVHFKILLSLMENYFLRNYIYYKNSFYDQNLYNYYSIITDSEQSWRLCWYFDANYLWYYNNYYFSIKTII